MGAAPFTEAGLSAGLTTRSQEVILLTLTTRRGLVLTTPQIASKSGLYERSVPGVCRQIEQAGLIQHVGKVSKSFTWVATTDGYALGDLIREEQGDQAPATPEPLPSNVVQLPPPEPAAVVVAAHPAGGRVEREEAIWRWLRQASRADLAGASHRLIDGLAQALAEEGHL